MRHYLRLMIPGMVMICAEWWFLEVAVLMAGLLNPSDLTIGAFTITATLQALALMTWIGLAVAASVEVGKCIGAANVPGARRTAACVLTLGTVLATLWCLTFVSLRDPIAQLFTSSPRINGLTSRLLPMVGLVAFLDSTSNTLGGICSGLGLQRFAAASQLLGYYVVGMPVGAILAFGTEHGQQDGVFGLWIGIGLSMLTAAILQSIALSWYDWASAADAAALRLASDAVGEEAGISIRETSSRVCEGSLFAASLKETTAEDPPEGKEAEGHNKGSQLVSKGNASGTVQHVSRRLTRAASGGDAVPLWPACESSSSNLD